MLLGIRGDNMSTEEKGRMEERLGDVSLHGSRIQYSFLFKTAADWFKKKFSIKNGFCVAKIKVEGTLRSFLQKKGE